MSRIRCLQILAGPGHFLAQPATSDDPSTNSELQATVIVRQVTADLFKIGSCSAWQGFAHVIETRELAQSSSVKFHVRPLWGEACKVDLQ